MEDVGIFYGRLVYLHILRPFGIFCGHLSILRPFGLFYAHLVYFVAMWNILWLHGTFPPHFGMWHVVQR
jgi:hypothetical protein